MIFSKIYREFGVKLYFFKYWTFAKIYSSLVYIKLGIGR